MDEVVELLSDILSELRDMNEKIDELMKTAIDTVETIWIE